mgnify:CR=1 FL=1
MSKNYISINPKIEENIKLFTKNNENIKNVIFSLISFELQGAGWYKDSYKKIIENYSGDDYEI